MIKMKIGGDDDEDKCINTMCEKKQFEEEYEKSKQILETLINNLKNEIKQNELESEKKKLLKIQIKNREMLLKKINNSTHKKKHLKLLRNTCKMLKCNKGCVGTLLQEGDPNKLPDELTNFFKNNKFAKHPFMPKLISFYTSERKKIFGKKRNVLKNNFYEGLPTTEINKMKKKGAISGCYK